MVMWLNSRPGRFNPATELRYPQNRRLVGPQIRPERFGKRKISYPCQNTKPRTSSPCPIQHTDDAHLGCHMFKIQQKYILLGKKTQNCCCLVPRFQPRDQFGN